MGWTEDDAETKAVRPEFFAFPVSLMDCTPGNVDRRDGVPALIVTIARKGRIEPLVFSMNDSRQLVAKLLVALATYDDDFAKRLLDENFPADGGGNFRWPATSDNES